MAPKFTTKSCFLTSYAMACGYLEVNQGWKEKRRVSMSLVNPGNDLYLIETCLNDHVVFHIYIDEGGIVQARKEYMKELRAAGAKRTINKG